VISRELGDDWGIAQSLNYLGFVALLRGVHERTAEVCAQAASMFVILGDGEGIAWSRILLGAAALDRGRSRAGARVARRWPRALAADRLPGRRRLGARPAGRPGMARRRSRAGGDPLPREPGATPRPRGQVAHREPAGGAGGNGSVAGTLRAGGHAVRGSQGAARRSLRPCAAARAARARAWRGSSTGRDGRRPLPGGLGGRKRHEPGARLRSRSDRRCRAAETCVRHTGADPRD
jgi:hypothetical protein